MACDIKQIKFLDLAKLETHARNNLQDTAFRLKSLKRPQTDSENKELALCNEILEVVVKNKVVCDPLFVATRELLNSEKVLTQPLATEQEGVLNFTKHADEIDYTLTALVLGIMAVDGASPPPVKVDTDKKLTHAAAKAASAAADAADAAAKAEAANADAADAAAKAEAAKTEAAKADVTKKAADAAADAAAKAAADAVANTQTAAANTQTAAANTQTAAANTQTAAANTQTAAANTQTAAAKTVEDAVKVAAVAAKAAADAAKAAADAAADAAAKVAAQAATKAKQAAQAAKVAAEEEAQAAKVAAEEEAKAKIIVPNTDHPLMAALTSKFYVAVGEARPQKELAQQVLHALCEACDPDGTGGRNSGVKTTDFARVMRNLAKRKIKAGDPSLCRSVIVELNAIQNVGGQDGITDLGIDLPDLEDIQDANIVADNVRVMGPMIVAAMFDELKVFQVVDRIVEQFQQGTLPIGPGDAGKLLYTYWRETPNRISEQERKNFAAITLGVTGGDPNVAVNREFNDLWIRFVSAVSSFVRQTQVDALLRASVPNPINHQQVRKAARDLASNLSLHGYGMAHYAAREIQSQVQFMINLLQDKEIRGCYGAKDMWQVIDQVATYDLGGAKTSSRYRTLATCGTIITAWLADNVTRINSATGPLLNIDHIAYPDVSSNHKATLHPTDYDLVNACELWLADTATTETQIEQYAQSRLTPQMTSKPVPIPAMAREMLDSIGDIGGSIGLGSVKPYYKN